MKSKRLYVVFKQCIFMFNVFNGHVSVSDFQQVAAGYQFFHIIRLSFSCEAVETTGFETNVFFSRYS